MAISCDFENPFSCGYTLIGGYYDAYWKHKTLFEGTGKSTYRTINCPKTRNSKSILTSYCNLL